MKTNFKCLRKNIFLVMLQGLIFFLSSVAPAGQNICLQLFSRNFLVSHNSLSLLKVLKLSALDLEYLNKQRVEALKYPLGRPEKILVRAIDASRSLSVEIKKVLLKELEHQSPFSQEIVRKNLQLALGDSLSWRDMIKSLVQEQPSDYDYFSVHGFWSWRVAEMPPLERQQILQHIGSYYNKARSSSDGHGSPKRDLDYLIHAASKGGELIISLIEKGKSPLSAYDQFMESQNKILFSAESKRGGYGADVVFLVLKGIQKKMIELGIDGLLIGGSFTAGRADLLRSDIDYVAEENLLSQERKMSSYINQLLKINGVKSKLRLENFPGRLRLPRKYSYPEDLASSNPILFMIKKQNIEMWIYPTVLWQRGRSYKSAMSDPKIIPILSTDFNEQTDFH